MKRLILVLAVLAICATPALAGWHYSATPKHGYKYYSAYGCGSSYSPAGYYAYYPTYTYPTYAYPVYSVSYSDTQARQLEIIAKAMDTLTRFAEQGNGNGGNGNGLRQTAPIKDGATILNVRCAACHEAGQVAAKGSKLTLQASGKPATLTAEQRANVVKRIYARDPKECMPPGKPLPNEEKAALAEFLGVTVVTPETSAN